MKSATVFSTSPRMSWALCKRCRSFSTSIACRPSGIDIGEVTIVLRFWQTHAGVESVDIDRHA